MNHYLSLDRIKYILSCIDTEINLYTEFNRVMKKIGFIFSRKTDVEFDSFKAGDIEIFLGTLADISRIFQLNLPLSHKIYIRGEFMRFEYTAEVFIKSMGVGEVLHRRYSLDREFHYTESEDIVRGFTEFGFCEEVHKAADEFEQFLESQLPEKEVAQ